MRTRQGFGGGLCVVDQISGMINSECVKGFSGLKSGFIARVSVVDQNYPEPRRALDPRTSYARLFHGYSRS